MAVAKHSSPENRVKKGSIKAENPSSSPNRKNNAYLNKANESVISKEDRR